MPNCASTCIKLQCLTQPSHPPTKVHNGWNATLVMANIPKCNSLLLITCAIPQDNNQSSHLTHALQIHPLMACHPPRPQNTAVSHMASFATWQCQTLSPPLAAPLSPPFSPHYHHLSVPAVTTTCLHVPHVAESALLSQHCCATRC
jgi:hypothetical protein